MGCEPSRRVLQAIFFHPWLQKSSINSGLHQNDSWRKEAFKARDGYGFLEQSIQPTIPFPRRRRGERGRSINLGVSLSISVWMLEMLGTNDSFEARSAAVVFRTFIEQLLPFNYFRGWLLLAWGGVTWGRPLKRTPLCFINKTGWGRVEALYASNGARWHV